MIIKSAVRFGYVMLKAGCGLALDASTIEGAIEAGTSIASVGSSFENYGFNVAFKLELENYSNDHLDIHQNKVLSGHVPDPPVPIKPGMKEAMAGHKTGNTATGCSGTVSWSIREKGKILVVMYSIPYSQDFHSNWAAVGIFNKGDTTGLFKRMYEDAEHCFKRKEFYRDTDPVIYNGDSDYTVQATMGTTHKAKIQVRLIPKQGDKLADNVLANLRAILGV